MANQTLVPIPDKILYFCDESSQGDEFLGVAGLAVNAAAVSAITTRLQEIKKQFDIVTEVKWGTVKRLNGRVHKLYIDYLFELIASDIVHFHIRFSELAKYDHSKSGARNKIDTVIKSFYQLILHRPMQYYGKSGDIHIRLDAGHCTSEVHRYIGAMHTEAYRQYGCQRDYITSIQSRDSASEPMLQLLDVTLGALTAYRNGRHLVPGCNRTRQEVACYAFGKVGIKSLAQSTSKEQKRCSIWNVRPLWSGNTVPGPSLSRPGKPGFSNPGTIAR